MIDGNGRVCGWYLGDTGMEKAAEAAFL